MTKSIKNRKSALPIELKRSFFMRNLWLITIGAFLLRLIVSWELGRINSGFNSVFTPSKFSDLATYLDLSKKIVEGNYEGVFYYQPYYYAVFLPLIRLISGGSIWAIIFAQAVVGSLTVWGVGVIAKELWNSKSGYIAALLTAISTPLLLYTPYAQNETLQAFHITFLALIAIKMLRSKALGWVIGCGLILGVATLTRGNALLFLPGIVAILVWQRCSVKSSWRKIILELVVLGVCFIAPQLPFIIHNSRELGHFSGPSTAADAVLALGNTPEAPAGGRNPGLPAGPMEYPESYSDFMARASERSVGLQMWDYLQRAPLEFLELQWRKVLLFWEYPEIPNNVSLYGEGTQSKVLNNLVVGRSLVLLSLGFAGLLLFSYHAFKRGRKEQILLYYLIVVYWLATALFYILSRFRAPIIPLVTVFAGAFVVEAWRLRKNKKTLYRGLISLVLGMFVVIGANDFYRNNLEASIIRVVRPNGTIYQLKDGHTVQLYHGPFTGGAWASSPLAVGMNFSKKFDLIPTEIMAEVEWKVLVLAPNSYLSGTINGVPFSLDNPDQGIVPVKLKTRIKEGKIEIYIRQIRGDIEFLYDLQRRYPQTTSDGELILRVKYL